MSEQTITAEFHCHTCWSKDSLLRPADLVVACRKKGINRVVVTDHNTIGGALEAQRIDPELVIVGEEIMTTRGEILAAFVQEEIPRGLEPMQVIRLLREQGAFISVSHPLDRIRNGAWGNKELDQIIDYVDAIEVFNARCWFAEDNTLAANFAREHQKPGMAGSDAHIAFELGRAVMKMEPFANSQELKQSTADAQIISKLSPWWVHLASRWASSKKKADQP